MFMFLFRRNQELRRQLTDYLEKARRVADTFRDGLRHYRQHGLRDLDPFARVSHRDESECDRVRREVERDLFARALLPESREDVMVLLEHLDLVVNQLEDVLRQIILQRIELPSVFQDAYAALVEGCHEAAVALFEQAAAALAGDPRVRDLGDAVKACESRVDQCEQQLVSALFASADLELARQLHYRDLITMTAAISDLAEDAANLLTVFALKREA
jgi:predicted phosphate transport protein (TIGR00153 family)